MSAATGRLIAIFRTSSIHSIGAFLNKFVLLAMVAVYAQLPKADFGLLGQMDTAEQFLIALLVLGQGQSFVWQFKKEPDETARITVFSTVVWFMLGLSALVVGFLALWPDADQWVFSVKHPYVPLAFAWLLISLFFRNIQSLAINFLRVTGRPAYLEGANLTGSVLFLGVSYVLIVHLRSGVESLMVTRLFLLFPVVFTAFWWARAYLRFRFDAALMARMLRYGLPFVLVGAAYPVLNFADRWMIGRLIDPTAALNGIYEMSYKFGMIPSMVLVGPFLQAWQPALYDQTDETTRTALYRKLLLYVTLLGSLLWLGLSVFSLDLLRIFSSPAYYSGHVIIPWVAASNVFYGIGWVVIAGLAVQERTFFIGGWTFLAAVLNVALNFYWIPMFGILGAAYATTLAFVFIFVGFAAYAHRHLRIAFPYGRFAAMIGTVWGSWLGIDWLPVSPNLWLGVAIKAVLCLPVVWVLLWEAEAWAAIRGVWVQRKSFRNNA